MSFDARQLLQLLPSIYGQRDLVDARVTPGLLAPHDRQRLATLERLLESGFALSAAEADELTRLRERAVAGPLGNLLGLLAEQLRVLEEDIEQLYDDQFIETCAEWVAPYIGDLIGYRAVHGVSEGVGRARAEVAHTIALRRRKGTVAVFEQLALDVTEWPAVAVEYFQRLITTQYVNHPRPHITASPDLRGWVPREYIGTAFDRVPRTVDVRSIERRNGRHNIPNLGLFLWRLRAQSLTRSPAARVDARRARFHPLGIDQALFSRPQRLEPFVERASPLHVPMPISRRAFAANPAAYYAADDTQRSLRLYWDRADGAGMQPVPLAAIRVCHLGDHAGTWAHLPPAGIVALDPELGRIGLPPEATDDWRVEVDVHHGFPADLGSGEYERADTFSSGPSVPIRFVPGDFDSIQDALDDLAGKGIVEIQDSGRYREALAIDVAEGKSVELRAANGRRPLLILSEACPLTGGADSQLKLNGLLIAGNQLRVPGAATGLASLELTHCTLVPGWTLAPDLTPESAGQPSLVVERDLTLTLNRSITGALRVAQGTEIRATDCVIDATSPEGLALGGVDIEASPAGALRLEGSTVIGRIRTRALSLVSNAIVVARAPAGQTPVLPLRRQEGCVRFSWLPFESRTPRRHRCLPQSPALVAEAVPRFSSQRYGRPDYVQLSVHSGPKLLMGADDEAEPGVYHHIRGAWREANLHIRLDEYLRVGLRGGVFFES